MTLPLHTDVEEPPVASLADETIARSPALSVDERARMLLTSRFGDYAESLALAQRALEHDASDLEARLALGMSLQKLGRSDEAIHECWRLLRVQPECGEAYRTMAYAMLHLDRLSDAVENFAKAAHLTAAARDYRALGEVLNRLGRAGEAREAILEGERVDPLGFAGEYFARGEVLERQGYREDALAAYRNALRLDPDDEVYRARVDAVGAKLEREQSAGPAAAEVPATREAETDAMSFVVAATELERTGKMEESLRLFREAAKVAPDNASMHSFLGFALARRGRHAEAARAHHQAVQLQPTNRAFHNDLGRAYFALGRYEEALAEHRLALRCEYWHSASSETDALILTFAGECLTKIGRLQEARFSHRDAVRLMPEIPQNWGNLALAAMRLERPHEAAACWERALMLDPDYLDSRPAERDGYTWSIAKAGLQPPMELESDDDGIGV